MTSVPVSCLIFTLNEEMNLPHCLDSLAWCDDVVVVDSFSTDRTEQIAREWGATFVQHEFTGFGDQRNWALTTLELKHRWALILDADERVMPELAIEFHTRLPTIADEVVAFRVRRRFTMWEKWLKYSSLYPTWVVRLVRIGQVRYFNRGHAETQSVEGRLESLQHDLIDENHKGLADWWERQIRYAQQDARYELSHPAAPLWQFLSLDPLRRREALKSLGRRLPARAAWFFLYSYVFRIGCLDGMDGFHFCRMKSMYQSMVTLYKRELKCRCDSAPQVGDGDERMIESPTEHFVLSE